MRTAAWGRWVFGLVLGAWLVVPPATLSQPRVPAFRTTPGGPLPGNPRTARQ